MGDQPVPLKDVTDMSQLIKRWEEESSTSGYDPIPILERMAEIVESTSDAFNRMDPDPFDERHPSRADPSCMLGTVLKVIFRKEHFMDKLVNDYMRDNYWSRAGFLERDATELNIAASRLLIDVMPGLEASVVFQTPDADSLVMRLFNWAEKAQDPLKTYAVGLLAAAMEIQDTAAVFREQNTKFVPIMLARLHSLQEEMALQRQEKSAAAHRPFAHLNHEGTPAKKKVSRSNSLNCGSPRRRLHSPPLMSPPPVENDLDKSITARVNSVQKKSKDQECMKIDGDANAVNSSISISDCSNSSWAEMESYVIASCNVFPLTLASKQMLILRYLTPMGEYQEFLSYIFEYNALALILNYTNIRETRETRLGFEALKYLAALLCHKKVSIEFINMGGLQRLLEVPRPSIAATGVSICFYYLAYCEDAMEKICMSPRYVITELVSYALWLLECSHNSGRCHATMYFSLSFQFRVILDEFDSQDGLRKLSNVISTLPILAPDEEVRAPLNEDEENSYRQIVRHVAVALKRYFEAHLAIKAEYYTIQRCGTTPAATVAQAGPPHKAIAYRSTPEEVQEQVEFLLEVMPFHAPWHCVDEFTWLGGITLLLRVIASAYEWNFSGRAETVQSALNVLAISTVRPSVQLALCERLQLPDQLVSVGMNIILGCCEGEVVPDPEVQKAALQVIINCVCAPIDRVGSTALTSSGKKRIRSSEELIQKMWASVRDNNGIIVLLMLMMVKTPITDADALRALACRALSGLVRCEKVRQIVSKLPQLSNGSLQAAIKDPILHEKRQEHVQFQKYYLQLLEHITGKNQQTTCEDLSLTNIYRANVVAQTRIQYSKNQLYQLIHQQLLMDGLNESASSLQREAGLTVPKPPTPAAFPSNRIIMPRASPKPPQSPRVLFPLNHSQSNSQPSTPTSPIKLSLNKKDKQSTGVSTPNRSLQKQTSWDSSVCAAAGIVPKAPNQQPYPVDRVTLHSIVTEYLTNQHALCRNPMVTCPQFNLFVPHKCPEPKSRIDAPINHTVRFIKRQTGFRIGSAMDIRFAHSRFCPERTIKISDDATFTCCEFLPNSSNLAMGTNHGELRLYNIHNGSEEAVYQCHDSFLYKIESNRAGDLMLTSSTWRRPLSILWRVTSLFDTKFTLDEEEYTEFSKTNQDKIVGTKGTTATIYDIESGTPMSKLTPALSNGYSKNRATFNPTDELILTDGVLFDVRTGQEIHKFDKLNSVLSGVFHPNGLEILSNTEIWDLRTFHLLRTVPALDHQHCLFNPQGSIIYTYSYEQENDDDVMYESSFKTIDSRNYSSIATIDTKKEIYHIACNKHDTQIAVVENQGEQHTVQETTVRVYEVGRRRDTEDEVEEEEDDDLSEDASNSGSNSDDNNDQRGFALIMADALDRAENRANNSEDDDPEFVLNSDDDDDENVSFSFSSTDDDDSLHD